MSSLRNKPIGATFILTLVISVSGLSAQDIIENPEKPDSVRIFRRIYKPVKFEPPAKEKQWYRERGFPDRYNDIQKLLVDGDHLWVLTSTIEKNRGILTDVFDREGKYLDCFYLPLPRLKQNWVGYPPMAIGGSFLYAVEWDKEGNIFIVQYQIGGET